ncbi:MAG: hypothetical protein WA814_13280 [Candidatus Baltobacteraceae bacterium]
MPLAKLTFADFKTVAKWGTIAGAKVRAECGTGYEVVAGGSSSSDGSTIGTGSADDSGKAWVVQPESKAKGEAFATCVSISTMGSLFQLVSAKPTGPYGTASAKCGTGFMLITGYGRGPIKVSWFDPRSNTFSVRGGATSYASCVKSDDGVTIKNAWNKSQYPKSVYAGCGDGHKAIAGSMGDSGWPGPPVQSHPGNANPGAHGSNGWWTFSHKENELTWAACVHT